VLHSVKGNIERGNGTDTSFLRTYFYLIFFQPSFCEQLVANTIMASWLDLPVRQSFPVLTNLVQPLCSIIRVGTAVTDLHIKRHHFTFLLIMYEWICNILWFIANINYIKQQMRRC